MDHGSDTTMPRLRPHSNHQAGLHCLHLLDISSYSVPHLCPTRPSANTIMLAALQTCSRFYSSPFLFFAFKLTIPFFSSLPPPSLSLSLTSPLPFLYFSRPFLLFILHLSRTAYTPLLLLREPSDKCLIFDPPPSQTTRFPFPSLSLS